MSDFMLPKNGYSFGLGIYHAYSKSFEVNMRALWELKGSRTSQYTYLKSTSNGITTITDETRTMNTNFNYFTFSALPTFLIGANKHFIIGAGAYYSILKKADVLITHMDHLSQSIKIENYRDLQNFSPKYDIGISFFIGYSIPFGGRLKVSGQVFYNLGIVDQYDPWNENQRNNNIGFMLAFAIMN
jgi:hypothetical protein